MSQIIELTYNLDQKPYKLELIGCACITRRTFRRKSCFARKRNIRTMSLPDNAPAMLIPKKDWKLRLVIHYRQLNKQTIKWKWPIPSFEKIFDTLEGTVCFTPTDLSAAIYKVPMGASSQLYTAFRKPFGAFKLLRMPMGLTGSPTNFQCLVGKVLVGFKLEEKVYLIWTKLSYFRRLPKNTSNDCDLFYERFRAHNLEINSDKCDFFRIKIPFLRHIVSKDGLQVDPRKLKQCKTSRPKKSKWSEIVLTSCLVLQKFRTKFCRNITSLAQS